MPARSGGKFRYEDSKCGKQYTETVNKNGWSNKNIRKQGRVTNPKPLPLKITVIKDTRI